MWAGYSYAPHPIIYENSACFEFMQSGDKTGLIACLESSRGFRNKHVVEIALMVKGMEDVKEYVTIVTIGSVLAISMRS